MNQITLARSSPSTVSLTFRAICFIQNPFTPAEMPTIWTRRVDSSINRPGFADNPNRGFPLPCGRPGLRSPSRSTSRRAGNLKPTGSILRVRETAHPIAHPRTYFWQPNRILIRKNLLRNQGVMDSACFTGRRSGVRVPARPPILSAACRHEGFHPLHRRR
jgi:hypothetical protein